MMAAIESKMGKAQIASGAAMATVAGPFMEPPIAKVPTTRPINILPASPKKILAGGKLNLKNPNRLPVNTAPTTATAVWPSSRAMIEIVAHRIMPIVVARPSMPSSKFREFMAPSNQKMVKATENGPSSILCSKITKDLISSPALITIAAATTCPSSLYRPRMPKRSSYNPKPTIHAPASNKPPR